MKYFRVLKTLQAYIPNCQLIDEASGVALRLIVGQSLHEPTRGAGRAGAPAN